MTAYTTVTDVNNYLGVTLSGQALSYANTMIGAVGAHIERVTHRIWGTSPITGEQYVLSMRDVYLKSAPVTSIEQVQIRTTIVGDTLQPLESGIDYELLDPAVGWLHFARGYGRGSLLLVDYTPNRPVPADLSMAACMIVAHTLYMSQHADRWGIKQAKLDEETVLSYDVGPIQIQVPQRADDTIAGYARPIWG